jgi:diaminohydroxyphosphoribosylaminopyrimidine deaminase / 5-amino-6-(5-phosphoribosylamino)uracil reductase
MTQTSTHRDWMKKAIDVSRSSRTEPGRLIPAPVVGVVIVKDGELLGESCRGETKDGQHAEFELLQRLNDTDLTGATVYTTLEPCSRRNAPKRPCAERLVERGIGAVYIGTYDPNPMIYRQGWRILRDGGVVLKDFDADLRNEIRILNGSFIDLYRKGEGDEGEATFDYLQNNKQFEITTSVATFVTQWSGAGRNSIHSYEYPALARHARHFEEIDDPGAYDFSNHAVSPRVNEIIIFCSGEHYLLVQILEVHAGPDHGSDHTSASIRWQVRPSRE